MVAKFGEDRALPGNCERKVGEVGGRGEGKRERMREKKLKGCEREKEWEKRGEELLLLGLVKSGEEMALQGEDEKGGRRGKGEKGDGKGRREMGKSKK